MRALIKRFIKEESGATMVEYAILVALISVVAILVISQVGDSVLGAFSAVQSQLTAVN
jgi:pilus assembly protein Flp/PilA